MMNYQLITQIGDKEFVPLLIDQSLVFHEFDSLNSFVQLNLPDRFKNVLCKPNIGFGCYQFLSTIHGLTEWSNANDVLKRKAVLEFSLLIHSIEHLSPPSSILDANESDWKEWKELLTKVFDRNHCRVWVSEEGIGVLWGLNFGFPQFDLASLNDLEPFLEDPLFSPFNKIDRFKIDVESSSKVVPSPSVTIPLTEGKKIAEIQADPLLDSDPVVIVPIEPTVKRAIQPKIENVRKENYKTAANVHRGVKSRWGKALIASTFLIFLILFGLWYLFSNRRSWENLKGFVPDQNQVFIEPIDSWKPIVDTATGRSLAEGLLNVVMMDGLLEHKGSMEFLNFLTDFKTYAIENNASINFIDTSFFRLQINIEEERRATFKDDIKRKFTQYKLLVWDEALFQNSAHGNASMVKVEDISKDLDYQNKVYNKIHCPEAWNITMGNSRITLAVIDNGFDLKHPELQGRAVKPYNVREKNSDVSPSQGQEHGTHVASIALANGRNNWGISGIAPECSLMPIKIGGRGSSFYSSEIIEALLYAVKNGANVINMSLGGYYSIDPRTMNPARFESITAKFGTDEAIFWDELFKLLDEKNISVVVAAGNENLPIGIDPFARSKGSIKVMALDMNGEVADFSNYIMKNNFGFVIAAPGDDIISAIPGNRFEKMDGTSMASPFVAGTIALMKSRNPNMTNKEIQRKLKGSYFVEYNGFQVPILNVYNAVQ